LFASIAGVDIKHVPHLVSVDGVNRIVDGEITMGFFNLPTVIDQIKAGKLKPLAVTSFAHSPHLPGVPALEPPPTPSSRRTRRSRPRSHRSNAACGICPPDRIRPRQMDADHQGGERQRGVMAHLYAWSRCIRQH
jgi:hypothetical protein